MEFNVRCRICYEQNDGMYEMFTTNVEDDVENNVLISAAFAYVTNIKISVDDVFNAVICLDCCARLSDAYKLKCQAEETHMLIKQLLQKQQGPSISSESRNDCVLLRGVKNNCSQKITHQETKMPEENLNNWIQDENTIDEYTEDEYTPEDDGETHTGDCSYVDVEELECPSIYIDDDHDGDMHLSKNIAAKDGVQFLTNHKLFNMGKDNENFDLPAPKVTTRKRRRTSHTVVHKCQVCERIFARKSNLVDHLRLHAKVKLFKCNQCDKSFVQIANYRTHMRTHTNERPYKCHICSKSYTQSSSLKIHIRSHTDERNYPCKECGKAFTNASDLGKHKRLHDPNKQFKCKTCGRMFAQKVNMLTHMRRKHPDAMQNK